MFEFGETPLLSLEYEAVEACVKFVCLLYDPKTKIVEVNKLRHKLFTQKNINGEKLPPTLDSLIMHLRRANYQCYIWKAACEPLLRLPSPIENGWKLVDGAIQQERMLNLSVPNVIVELTRCNCKKGCKTQACSCRRENLNCTDSCRCNDADESENVHSFELSSDEDSDDDI